MKSDAFHEVVRSAPPVSVGGLTLWGIYLNEWVMIATLVWTLYLIVDKTPTIIARIRGLWRWFKSRSKHEQGK